MNVYAFLIIILYLSSAGSMILRLLLNPSYHPPRILGLGLGALGVLLQTVLLYQAIITSAGINLGFFNALSLAAWTVMVTLLLSSITKPVDNLGIVVFPIGVIIIGLERNFSSVRLLTPDVSWV